MFILIGGPRLGAELQARGDRREDPGGLRAHGAPRQEYIYIYIYMYICICICASIHTHTCIHIWYDLTDEHLVRGIIM